MSRTAVASAPEPSTAVGAAGEAGPNPIGLGAASGVGLYLAFEPAGAWWLAWAALVPFLMLVRSERRAAAVGFGAWVGGLVFWLLAVSWVRLSHESAWPGWLALAGVLSVWWPVTIGLVRVAVRKAGLPLMVAAPAVWIAVEYVRGLYPLNGFQWFFLAQSQHRALPLIQVADLTGAWGVGLLVALVNAWIVDLIQLPRWRSGERGRRPTGDVVIKAAVVVAGVAGCLAYGGWRLGASSFEPGPRLAMLQSDLDQDFDNPHETAEVLGVFRRLVGRAIEGPELPDLIVWPETMFPMGYVEVEDGLDRAEFARQVASIHPDGRPSWWRRRAAEGPEILGQWVRLTGVPMLFGINTYHFRREGLGRYNTALLMGPEGDAVQMYHKLHLVPFGEYVPLVETVPWVLALTPFDADRMPGLQPGRGPTVLEVGPWRLAAAICFEDSVPQVARALVAGNGDRQPDVLLNLSNDGWFRGTAAHRLHLANSVLRAVELRVPVARAVNTGISAVIDGDGKVLEALPEAAEGVLTRVIPLDPRESLYARWGDWLPIGCLGIIGLALPMAVVRSRR